MTSVGNIKSTEKEYTKHMLLLVAGIAAHSVRDGKHVGRTATEDETKVDVLVVTKSSKLVGTCKMATSIGDVDVAGKKAVG